jgi:hypothetical protein
MAQADVILISIAVLWLTVATTVIGACRVAALGDAVAGERTPRQRTAIRTGTGRVDLRRITEGTP